jgi:HTH-type transcriptional regulator/antitoxin MqsA
MTSPIPKTRIHPETGQTLHRGTREIEVAYRGLKRVVRVKGWFPMEGGDGILWRDDGAAADRALVEMKAEHAKTMG